MFANIQNALYQVAAKLCVDSSTVASVLKSHFYEPTLHFYLIRASPPTLSM
jgi:hypothetical protein